MNNSAKSKILSIIHAHNRGWAFSANDFLPGFKRYEIDESLSTLTEEGAIRRCIRGIYDYPMVSTLLNKEVAPDIEQIAQALARKYRWQILPNGDTALNYLGLSTQVPGVSIYLSSGRSKKYDIDGRMLKFQNTMNRESLFKYPESALVTQALRALGKEHITPQTLQTMREKFSDEMWKKIEVDTTTVTGWIYDYIRQLANGEVQ